MLLVFSFLTNHFIIITYVLFNLCCFLYVCRVFTILNKSAISGFLERSPLYLFKLLNK